MFFTNIGRVYVERVHEIPDMGRASKGRSIANLLELRAEEKIAALIRVESKTGANKEDITWQQKNELFFATQDGTVKKTALEEFANVRKGGIIAIGIDPGNALIDVKLTRGAIIENEQIQDPGDDVVLITHGGMSIRFSESDVRSMGRAAAGVKGITLEKVTASDGKFYAPPDTYARVAQGSRAHAFHHTGRTSFEVPTGKLRLDAVKGFEYIPEQAEVEIKPGAVTAVTFKLRRLTDLKALGWYSGSTHMHMNYGGNLHNSLDNQILMSAAEDQQVVNELIANKDNRVLDYQYFEPGGGAHSKSTRERLVIVGQEYRPPFYGHVILLGLRDHLLSPWSTGYEGTGIESLYPSNTDILRKAQAQKATTDYAHSFGGDNDPLQSPELGQAKGFIVDAALKTANGIEWAFSGRAPFFPWYAVLNNGLRVTGTGGEDSMSDLHISKLVGSSRTYVYTGSKGLDARAWMDGLAQGRAFMSTGPLIGLTVNGRMPGEEVTLPAGGNVSASGWVQSIVPLTKVMLIANGEVLEEIPLAADRRSATFTKQVKVTRSSWLHLRVEGDAADRHPLDTGFPQAFTSPVWVTVGGQPVRHLAAAEYCIKWIDKLQALAAADPGWRSKKEQDHVFAQFEEARQIYKRFAQEASQMKTTTSQAAEVVPGPSDGSAADGGLGIQLAGMVAAMGAVLAVRVRGSSRTRRVRARRARS
jgi:hypothetical protein